MCLRSIVTLPARYSALEDWEKNSQPLFAIRELDLPTPEGWKAELT